MTRRLAITIAALLGFNTGVSIATLAGTDLVWPFAVAAAVVPAVIVAFASSKRSES